MIPDTKVKRFKRIHWVFIEGLIKISDIVFHNILATVAGLYPSFLHQELNFLCNPVA